MDLLGGIIGNTPLIKIHYRYQNKEKSLYTKLEYYNLTGSIKDRVAYYMIKKAKARGELKDHMLIVEATSGNTGIALAGLGAYFKHPVHIFMPDWASQERVSIMKSYGAEVTLISKQQGGFKRCLEEAKKLAKNKNGFLANQFSNSDNLVAHYETTGKEILEQMPEVIGGFVSGVGTGGTLMGVGQQLRRGNEDFVLCAIEPDKMPLLSHRKIIGQHKIEGIGDDFIPDLIDRNSIDRIILVNDEDSINMARKLSKELGLGVGISSGANFLGAVSLGEKIEKAVVTVFADDNKKYLTTDLSKPIDEKEQFVSNQIELLGYEVVGNM